MSWYNQGYDDLKNEEERVSAQYGIPRFWMKVGSVAELVFIDSDPICIHEHSPKIDGSWNHHYTCMRETSPDDVVCCELLGRESRHYIGYYTVVDCSEWKDKKGNVHQFETKLFGAKLGTLKILKAEKEDRGGSMAGKVYKVRRIDDKQPAVGNVFSYQRDADMEKLYSMAMFKGKKISDLFKTENEDEIARLRKTFRLPSEGAIPAKMTTFNYWEVLNPKKPKDMRDALRGVRVEKFDGSKKSGSSGSSGGDGQSEDNVPF